MDKYGHAVNITGWQWAFLAEEAARLNRKPTALLQSVISEWVTRQQLKVVADRAVAKLRAVT
jgi:hypothetical protein